MMRRSPEGIGSIYFTGGSTGLAPLVSRLSSAFPAAQVVKGDRLASVARGLGVHAQRLFGARSPASAVPLSR